MRILRLPIRGEWRASIDAGIKGDEYRDIKAYYISRFFENLPGRDLMDMFESCLRGSSCDLETITRDWGVKIREYDAVELIEGYGRKAPRSLYEWKGLSAGRAAWTGALRPIGKCSEFI